MGLKVHGADISHWQSNVNLKRAVEEGLHWLYHKATQGGRYVDENYYDMKGRARANNLPFGGYHFMTVDVSPEEQARHFLRTIKPKPGDLRPMLDVEGRDFARMSVQERTVFVRRFVRVVRKTIRCNPIIYTNLDMGSTFGNCMVWVPRYNDDNRLPLVPKPWKKINIWQFSDGRDGDPKSYPGLGHVDLNTMQNKTQSKSLRIPKWTRVIPKRKVK